MFDDAFTLDLNLLATSCVKAWLTQMLENRHSSESGMFTAPRASKFLLQALVVWGFVNTLVPNVTLDC